MAKRVLVAPLEWGLGHATRCMPIIDELLSRGIEVVIGGNGRSLLLLKKEYPDLEIAELPDYRITYPSKGSVAISMARQLPYILSAIRSEHTLLDELIKRYRLDLIISDNRFGLWSKIVPCVYITHQPNISTPLWLKFSRPVLRTLHRYVMSRYTECWIPDFVDDKNISGYLSHGFPVPQNTHYIGILSRFDNTHYSKKNENSVCDLVAIMSGPEPQRSIFERLIVEQAKALPSKTLIIGGVTERDASIDIATNVSLRSHMVAAELITTIVLARYIVMRAGYSSIMDMIALGKSAILVPTPGQTEQEYLAMYLKDKNMFYSEPQNRFNLGRAVKESEDYSVKPLTDNRHAIRERIDVLLG